MKRIILISLCFLFIGCDYYELNDYMIVNSIAIDYQNNKYVLSALFNNYNDKTDEKNKSLIYQGKGDNIYDSFNNLKKIVPKKIYMNQLSIVILSEDIAHKGIVKALDLLKENTSRHNFNIYLSKDTTALHILKLIPNQINYKDNNLSNNILTNYINKDNNSFNQVLYSLLNPGINPYINSYKMVKSVNKEMSIKESNIAIFKDDKFISWTNNKEEIGFKILNNKLNKLSFKSENTNYDITSIKNRIKIDKNKDITFNIKLNCIINTDNFDGNKKHKKVIKNEIDKYIDNSINMSKKYQVDLFGIGLKYYQKYPKEFNTIDNWNNEIKNLNYKTKYQITIQKIDNKYNIERKINEKNI